MPYLEIGYSRVSDNEFAKQEKVKGHRDRPRRYPPCNIIPMCANHSGRLITCIYNLNSYFI